MKMAHLLGAAIAVAAAAALGFGDYIHRPTPISAEKHGEPMAALPRDETPNDGTAISGSVLESIDVAKYTYLRLSTRQGETWAAVPTAPVARGASVTVEHAIRMDHFASTTLKRTFDVIYFGSVAGASGTAGDPPEDHPAVGSNADQPIKGHLGMGKDPGVPEALLDEPSGALPPGHPSIGQGAMPADGEQALPPGHPGAAAPTPSPLVVPKLTRAPGSNGYLIASVYANERRLAGQRVRVRGLVTKVTPNVLGATFLHVHDGSGDAASQTDDLAIKTLDQPTRGDIVIFEGVLRSDVDVGAGYRYKALLEDATVVKE
jgi:hypothetical protein